jgi:hypothetical protein
VRGSASCRWAGTRLDTDAAGAAGIVAGRELWATDALFMDDASELQIVQRDFTTVIKSDITDSFLDPSERERMGTAFEEAVGRFREDPGPFVVCFCENGDLLSQWNTYGRDGGGYAVGFEGAALGSYVRDVSGSLRTGLSRGAHTLLPCPR